MECCHVNPGDQEEWHLVEAAAASSPSSSSSWSAGETLRKLMSLPKVLSSTAASARYAPTVTGAADRHQRRTMKRIHDIGVIVSRRVFINEEIVELRKMIHVARQEGLGRPTGWEEKAIEDRIEKLRIMDEENVMVFEDESRLQMTRRQIRKNRWLIKKEKAMHRKGRTWDSCYADWHEERLKEQRYNAQSAQETAEAAAASAQGQSANAASSSSSSQANREGDDEDRITAAQYAEVRAAIADYKRRFIAKHGQAEWDKEFMARPGRSRTVLPDLLAQHYDNVWTRSPRQVLAPGTHVLVSPSVLDTCM